MDLVRRRMETIECTVLGSLYKKDGPGHLDISMLHSGTYNSPNFLELSTDPIPLNAIVDVIGYPGRHSTEFILSHSGLAKPFQEHIASADTLLPAQTLTVTRGTIETVGSTISYRISTCPGMSGSCLLYKGKAFGKRPMFRSLLTG